MKQHGKKLALVLLAAFTAFALCACSSGKTSEESYEVDGLVTAVGGGKLTITSTAQQNLTFNIENAKISSDTALSEGNYVAIYYTGKIENGDTGKCTVESVQKIGGIEEVASGGLVSFDGANKKLTLKLAAGEATFSVSQAEFYWSKPVTTGMTVYLLYTGILKDTDTSGCTVWFATDTAIDMKSGNTTVAKASDTVYTTSDTNLRAAASYTSPSIKKLDKDVKLTRTGTTSNGWSRVKYNDTEGYVMTLFLTTTAPSASPTPTPSASPTPSPSPTTSPTPSPSPTTSPTPTPSERHTIVGELLDFNKRGGNITIKTDKEKEYEFLVEQAVIHIHGDMEPGITLRVTYFGDLVEGDIMDAVMIEDLEEDLASD